MVFALLGGFNNVSYLSVSLHDSPGKICVDY